MRFFLQKLHFGWFMLMIAFSFCLLFPFFYYNTRRFERYIWVGKFRKLWTQMLLFLSGFRYKIYLEEPLNPTKTYIYISNHASYLDTPMMCLIAQGNYHFMGKAELLKNPILRLFFKTIDVPVDRSNKVGRFQALKKVESNLDKGLSIIIYPEGTMSKNPPRLGEFRNGAFTLALDKKVPIVPICFVNNYKMLSGSGKKFGSKPGRLVAYVHKPVSINGAESEQDVDLLKQKLFNMINKTVQEHAN